MKMNWLICLIIHILFLCQDSTNLLKLYQTYPLFLLLLNFYLYHFYQENIFEPYIKHSVRFIRYGAEIAILFLIFVLIKIILVILHYSVHISPILSISTHFAIYMIELYFYIYPEINISNWNYSHALSLKSPSNLAPSKQFNEWKYQVSDIIPSLNRINEVSKETNLLFAIDNVSIYKNQIVLVRKFKRFNQKSGFNYILAKVLSFEEKIISTTKYYEIQFEEMLNPNIITIQVLSPRKFIIPAKISPTIEKENLNSSSNENNEKEEENEEVSERERVAHLFYKSFKRLEHEFYWGSRFIKIKSSGIFDSPYSPKSSSQLF